MPLVVRNHQWGSLPSVHYYNPSGVGHGAGAVAEGAGVDAARMILGLIGLL